MLTLYRLLIDTTDTQHKVIIEEHNEDGIIICAEMTFEEWTYMISHPKVITSPTEEVSAA